MIKNNDGNYKCVICRNDEDDNNEDDNDDNNYDMKLKNSWENITNDKIKKIFLHITKK